MAGVPPTYTVNDELRCLILIPEEGISRAALKDLLELGEGAVRSILDDLKLKKLIDSTQGGHFITERGKSLIEKFKKRITIPMPVETSLYANKSAGLLVHVDVSPDRVISLRDHAIKRGADAAIIAGREPINSEVERIKEEIGWKPEDTLVLCFAESERDAFNAALAVAQQIDEGLAAEVALTLEF